MAESKKPSTRSMLQQLMDNMTDNIYFMDREGRLIMLNRAGADWLGFDHPDEAIGKTDYDIFTEEHASDAFEDEQRIIRTGEPVVGKEEKETWGDGHTTWVSTTKMPLRDEQNNIVGVFGISRNITEQKLNEIKLKQYARRLSQINERMEEELRMAANLQRVFLPQYYPAYTDAAGRPLLEFHHYYQADIHVGGDLCSIHRLSDTRAGLLICDVMGHGVRAALITAVIRTLANELAQKAASPGDFFTELNRQLFPMLRAHDAFMFVTASFVVLDVSTGELTGSCAGHTLPLLIRPGDGEVRTVSGAKDSAGCALAVSENYAYGTFRSRLQPGDTLMLYTDGIYEVLNAEGSQFGLGRLQQAFREHAGLPLPSMVERVVEAVRGFSAHGEFEDDVCLLAVTLKDTGLR